MIRINDCFKYILMNMYKSQQVKQILLALKTFSAKLMKITKAEVDISYNLIMINLITGGSISVIDPT